MIRSLLFLTSVLVITTAVATAHTAEDSLKTIDAWARATPPSAQTGAVYVTFRNDAQLPMSITGGTSVVCTTVEIHDHIKHEDGSAEMVRIQALDLEPGKSVTLKPGGLHIMLIGLRSPLVEGNTIALTLTTNDGESYPLEAKILGAGAVCACCEE
jgi:periplasmic copper chaperone A